MIKPKGVIQRKDFEPYDEKNFKAPKNFFICSAEEVLQRIKPLVLDNKKFICIDTETHPTDLKSEELPPNVVRRWIGTGKSAKPQDFPFCISLCDGVNAFTVFDSYENDFQELHKLAPLLEDASIGKICHNVKYDMHMLHNAGLKFAGEMHDTVILTKLVNENRNSFKLVDLARALPEGITTYEDMVDFYKKLYKVVDYRQIPTVLLGAYANADVWNCIKVFEKEYLMLEDCKELYYNECKLTLALYDMERVGMKVDINYRPIVQKELQERADAAEAKVYELAGMVFNANSTKQLYEVLMRLGVNPSLIAKTDKGNPKLDKDALAVLDESGVELVSYLLEYRQSIKLLNTYVIGIYGQRDAAARVHGSINQVEAVTGRMSVTKPGLQTLNKSDTTIRKAFIPENGYKLVFIDLDQIEFRLLAHYAKAEDLIKMIAEGHDVHSATATLVFGNADNDNRSKAKTLNFAIVYGMGSAALAENLKVSQSEAYEFKRKYFAQIPELEPFIYNVQNVNKARGYIRTFFGRMRRLRYDESYKAVNSLIQGTAADLIKLYICRMHEFLKDKKTRIIMVVHDELVIEVHDSELNIIKELKSLMEDHTTFRVPLTAGVEIGNPNWGAKKEWSSDT